MADELKSHRVVVQRELAADLPLVDGHHGQLLQVISNLVNNAIEAMNATPNRNRLLQVRTQLREPASLVVEVQDSGPGIPPEKLDGIFGAFFTTKAQGMGLGLAICRMIIEHHGGQLTASSDGSRRLVQVRSADPSRTAWLRSVLHPDAPKGMRPASGGEAGR